MAIVTTTSDPITEYLRNQPLVVEVVEPEMAAVLRDKTEAERYSIALGLWHFARNTIRRQLAADHPDWTQDQVYREATRRLLHES
jgi:hypothetical protein